MFFNKRYKWQFILLSLAYILMLYRSITIGTTYFILLFCVLGLLLIPIRNKLIDNNSVWLLLFSISYFFILSINSENFSSRSLIYLLAPFIFYSYGKYVIKELRDEKRIISFILITLFFFACQTYTLTIGDILNNGFININRTLEREIGGHLSATLYGLNVSLGFAGLSLLFFLDNYNNKILRFAGTFLSILSLTTILHLLNRTGLVLLVIVLIISFVYHGNSRKKIFLLCFLGGLSLLVFSSIIDNSGLLEAYSNRNYGVNNNASNFGGRSQRWLEAIFNTFQYPFGWEKYYIYDYAHNLWLDVSRLTGFLPFLFLLIATLKSAKNIYKIYKLEMSSINLLFITVYICFLMSSFTEPIIEGFDLYFYLMCMFWGISKQYLNVKKQQHESYSN